MSRSVAIHSGTTRLTALCLGTAGMLGSQHYAGGLSRAPARFGAFFQVNDLNRGNGHL